MAETPADTTFDANTLLLAVQALGETPVVNDLEGRLAWNELHRQAWGLVAAKSQAATSLVFSPGNPNPSGSVFSDWDELYAFYSTFDGPMDIYFDDTFVSPVVVPLGTYTFRQGTRWRGFFRDIGNPLGNTRVEITDGTQIVGVDHFLDAIQIEAHGVAAVPFVQIPNNGLSFNIVERGAGFRTLDAGGRCWEVPDGEFLFFVMREGGIFLFGASEVVRLLAPGSVLATNLYEQSQISVDTIAGPGFHSLDFISAFAIYDLPQTGFTGALSQTINQDAFKMVYTPTTLANWSGVSPTSIGDALDRIASHVGPIP